MENDIGGFIQKLRLHNYRPVVYSDTKNPTEANLDRLGTWRDSVRKRCEEFIEGLDKAELKSVNVQLCVALLDFDLKVSWAMRLLQNMIFRHSDDEEILRRFRFYCEESEITIEYDTCDFIISFLFPEMEKERGVTVF